MQSTPRPPCHPSGLLPQVMLVISQGHWQQRVASELEQPFVQLLCNEIKPDQRITQGRAAPAAQQALPQHQQTVPGPPEQHTGRVSNVTWPMPCPACAPACAGSQNQNLLALTGHAQPQDGTRGGPASLQGSFPLGHRTFPSLQPLTLPQSSGTPIPPVRALEARRNNLLGETWNQQG